MLRMNDIWDRTTQVLRGRASMLGWIAFLLSFLPRVVQGAVTSFFTEHTVSYYLTTVVISIAAALLAMWGGLALVAAASDPTHDRQSALALGASRLPAAIGLALLSVLAALVLFAPMLVMFGMSGISLTAITRGARPTHFANVSPGTIGGAFLYLFVIVLPVALWLGARLAVFTPVIVNERQGLRTFARSWRLTVGLTWRIIGVFLLFSILYFIAVAAAQLVVSLLFRIILGVSGTRVAVFLGSTCAAALAAAFAVVTSTFTAQLYRALTGREAAETFA